jgi:hypothetical protein
MPTHRTAETRRFSHMKSIFSRKPAIGADGRRLALPVSQGRCRHVERSSRKLHLARNSLIPSVKKAACGSKPFACKADSKRMRLLFLHFVGRSHAIP